MSRKRFYNADGKAGKKFQTTGFIRVDSFRLDVGVHAQDETQVARWYKKGDMILGFRARVTEIVESEGAGTLQLGFTGIRMLSAAIALANMDAIGDLIGPDLTNGAENGPYLLPADDSFDVINATAAFTGGKFDVDVVLLPADPEDLGSNFHEYVSTA